MTTPRAEVVELDGGSVLRLRPEVVELDRTPVPEVVEVGGRATPVGPQRLADLRDVDAPPATGPAGPAVLVRGPDNVYRPVAVGDVAPAQRGSVVHYLEYPPTSPPPGARVGDWVTVVAGDRAGTVYHVQEA